MLNKVILIGNLGRDPEVRYLPSGDAVANFSIATSENWKDRNGQRQERTEWHNISMFGRLAEIAGQYLKKGSKVYIEGRIQSRKYTGKDGIERTAYDIVANEMKMLGSRGGNQQQGGYHDDAGYAPAPQQNYAPQPQQPYAPQQPAYDAPPPAAPTQRQAPVAPAAPVDDIDDDIPF